MMRAGLEAPRLRRAVLALALAGAVAVWLHGRRAPHGSQPEPSPAQPANAPPAGAAQPQPVEWSVATTLARDPFAFAVIPNAAPARRTTPVPVASNHAPEVAPPEVRVQILLLDPTRPLAIVNRQRVAVGDSIAGYRVVAIDAGGVTVEGHGKRFTSRP